VDGGAIADGLLSAPVVAFVVALVATLLRLQVRLPDPFPPILSAFLLLAIGLKGGRNLAASAPSELLWPVVAALAIGIVTPLVAYAVMRSAVRLEVPDAAGVAAHYGSVSAVTFLVVIAAVEARGLATEGVLAGLLVLLEIVGIVVGLALAGGALRSAARVTVLAEVLRGRSVALLVIGLVIGTIVGDARLAPSDPLFVGLFTGALVLFLIEMGAIAAERLREVAAVGPRLVVAAVVVPLVNGALGAIAGDLAGLSTGGVAVLATLAASASYIAAPAAVRIALPEANPAISITAALGVTFPFNLVVGIPLYLWMATQLTAR
jgi:uncharacterized protein